MASETVTIRESRGWVLVYLLGSFALSALFTSFVYGDWKDGVTVGTLVSAGFVAAFWVMTGAFVYRLARPLDLLVSESGFRLTNWKQPTSWADVERFSITWQRYDFWSRRMVYRDHGPGLRLVTWRLKPTAPRPMHTRLGRVLSGVDGILPHTLTLDAAKLLAFVEQQRQRHALSLEKHP